MNYTPDFPLGPIIKWMDKCNINIHQYLPDVETPPRFVSHWTAHQIFVDLQKSMPDQPVGLIIGEHGNLADLGLDGQIAQHCNSLRHAHQMYLHYRSMTRPGSVRLESDPEQSTDSLVINPFFSPELVESDESRLVYPLALGLNIFRGILGEPRLDVHSAHLMLTDERFRTEYEEFFGGEVFFNCPENRLVFHSADFDRPIRAAVPETRPFLEQLALTQKAHVSPQAVKEVDFLELIKLELHKAILAQDFEQATIARRLCIGPRTLQRRLSEHGLKFRTLVENVQEKLALEFLLKSDLSIHEIAYKIGYQQPASFHRAFKRWTGKSPTEVRAERAEDKKVNPNVSPLPNES